MEIQTLLREREAIILSRIPKHDFPPADIADIFNIEMAERRNCLGEDFYDALLADLVDYSAVESFVKGTAYTTGQVVEYKGIYYKAVSNTSNEPTVATDWDYAPKFTTAIYEEFWCKFLGRYLALIAVRNSMAPTARKLTGAGVIKVEGDNFTSAKDNEIVGLYNHTDALITLVYDNLHSWVLEKKEGGETAFDTYKRILEDESSCTLCQNESQYYEISGECTNESGCTKKIREGGNTWAIY